MHSIYIQIVMHTFWKKGKEKKLSSLLPSMEGQTHTTLGKKTRRQKKVSLYSPSMKSQTHLTLHVRKGKRKKKKKKKK